MSPAHLGREVFCCGLGRLWAGVREMLSGLAFDMAHLHEERCAARQPEKVPLELVPPVEVVENAFTVSRKAVAADGRETIFAVAKGADFTILSSCSPPQGGKVVDR